MPRKGFHFTATLITDWLAGLLLGWQDTIQKYEASRGTYVMPPPERGISGTGGRGEWIWIVVYLAHNPHLIGSLGMEVPFGKEGQEEKV